MDAKNSIQSSTPSLNFEQQQNDGQSTDDVHPEMQFSSSNSAAPYIENEQLEIDAAEKVINAMRFYQKFCMVKLKRRADAIKSLPEEDRILLHGTNAVSTEHMRQVRDCVERNQKLLEMIVNCGANILGGSVQRALETHRLHPSNDHYMTKTRSILKQIVRDWSAEGALERESSYRLVLDEMNALFPPPSSIANNSNSPLATFQQRHNVQVLVTGAGLARLAWELRRMGFSVIGNEFSYFMLLTSNFILNACQEKEEFTIYPYVLDFSNSWCYEDQLKAIRFPDVNPADFGDEGEEEEKGGGNECNEETGENENCNNANNNTNNDFSSNGNFGMCAGDFLQSYANANEQFDSVVSVFFLDTGANPLAYIRLIYRILKPGGYWLNFGPLTYHHEDSDDTPSLELPFQSILRLVEQYGFSLIKVLDKDARRDSPSFYTWNPDSMLQYAYYCGYFVARRR